MFTHVSTVCDQTKGKTHTVKPLICWPRHSFGVLPLFITTVDFKSNIRDVIEVHTFGFSSDSVSGNLH